MIASGAACLGGAVVGRSRIGIAAAALMLFAMLDLALVRLVPALVWALALVAAAIALGARLRAGSSAMTSGPATEPVAHEKLAQAAVSLHGAAGLQRAVMVASAVGYVAMAWLVMTHEHGAGDAVRVSDEDHPAHAGQFSAVAVIPYIAIVVLIAVQLACFFTSLRAGRRLLALEAGAMAAMLLAMFIPGVLS